MTTEKENPPVDKPTENPPPQGEKPEGSKFNPALTASVIARQDKATAMATIGQIMDLKPEWFPEPPSAPKKPDPVEQQTPLNTADERVTKLEMELARERAISRYGISEAVAGLLRGSPDDILSQASAIASEYSAANQTPPASQGTVPGQTNPETTPKPNERPPEYQKIPSASTEAIPRENASEILTARLQEIKDNGGFETFKNLAMRSGIPIN